MATKDDQALNMVLTVLQSEALFRMKPFMMTPKLKFAPGDLGALVGDISLGYVQVKFKRAVIGKGTRSGDSVAFYDSGKDTIFVNFTEAFSISLQALIIHEATHALCDKNGYRMDIGQSESMAYIAQFQYGQLRLPLNSPRWTGDVKSGSDEVFKLGWPIATVLLDGTESGNSPLHAMYLQPMRGAVNKHPFYKNKTTLGADFDGLKRKPK